MTPRRRLASCRHGLPRANSPRLAMARRAAGFGRVAVAVLRLGACPASRVRRFGAEPDRHDDHLRVVVQHADGSGGLAVVLPFGAVWSCRLQHRDFLNAAGAGDLPVPMELIPLLAGLSGLGFAAVFGYMATKQRSTAFAMITLGIVQLVTTAATMFHHFFGGEGGVKTDRMIDNSLFGLKYAHAIEVYYLIVAWTLIAAIGMYFHTNTPLGRMANACRDNHERAQFVGYDPRIVRFLQFSLAGFYAGIAGGLFAITYEIVTFDAVAAPLAANALLMAYIGGATTFLGPVLGAILITLLQSVVSLMSNSWLVYVGVLFITMVIFAPAGITGIILKHAPIMRAGLMRRLVLPYSRILVPGVIVLFGSIGLVELLSFLTIGRAQGKRLELFGQPLDIQSVVPWLICLLCLLGGGFWLARESRQFKRVWDGLMEIAQPGGSP